MPKRKRQEGGRKEAPLAAVGSSGVGSGQQGEKLLTPSDAEYNRYSEMLKVLFKKLTRWQEIFATDGRTHDHAFGVFHSENGLTIRPDRSTAMDDPPEKILDIRSIISLNKPQIKLYHQGIYIRPGPAGKHLLVDPEDGKPVKAATIEISSDGFTKWQRLEVRTEREGEIPRGRLNYRGALYGLSEDSLRVSHKYGINGVMTDAMATSLINTIDALIPVTPSPTPQTEQRAMHERGIARLLRLLSAPARRWTAGRKG